MPIRDGVVKCEISEEASIDVELLVGFGCEQNTGGVYPTISCLLEQIVFRIGRVLKEPEDTVEDSL